MSNRLKGRLPGCCNALSHRVFRAFVSNIESSFLRFKRLFLLAVGSGFRQVGGVYE